MLYLPSLGASRAGFPSPGLRDSGSVAANIVHLRSGRDSFPVPSFFILRASGGNVGKAEGADRLSLECILFLSGRAGNESGVR